MQRNKQGERCKRLSSAQQHASECEGLSALRVFLDWCTSHPREHAAPVSSLLSQGRCDIADSRALLRQNDVLHAASLPGTWVRRPRRPAPRGSNSQKDYNRRRGRRCCPYFHDVCTEGNTMTLMVDAVRTTPPTPSSVIIFL